MIDLPLSFTNHLKINNNNNNAPKLQSDYNYIIFYIIIYNNL